MEQRTKNKEQRKILIEKTKIDKNAEKYNIDCIKDILYQYEKRLSDGYKWYCGAVKKNLQTLRGVEECQQEAFEVDQFLTKIAKEIIDKLLEDNRGKI